MKEVLHQPVMPAEVLAALDIKQGDLIVDATFGAGGHSRLFIEKGAKVIAFDQDPGVLNDLDIQLFRSNFRHIDDFIEPNSVDGVFFDLGVSSMQLDQAEKGFSYRQNGPLDMRMSGEGLSARDLVNEFSFEDIAKIIYQYGEDRFSRRIARAIVHYREKKPIETTLELAEIIAKSYPTRSKAHPARRTFQAFRIYVNDELGSLQDGLKAAQKVLKIGGHLAVLSFHSLEDRIVKRFLKTNNWKSKGPLIPNDAEIEINSRSRSAKFRFGEKCLD